MQKENLKKNIKEQKGVSVDTKKEIAKIGMTASLGVVVATSFYLKNKLSKRLHVGAGAALVGFSLWHHFLYKPDKPKKVATLAKTNVPTADTPKKPISKNISLKDKEGFVELGISKEFDTKDLDALKEVAKNIKSSNLLIRMPQITHKKLGLWNKFIDTIKQNAQIQKCAIYSIGMKKYLKNRPKEWEIVGTYKGSKALLVAS